MSEEGQLYLETREKWRDWLTQNHIKKNVIWLIYLKNNSKIPTIPHGESVEEALCFGWIDGKIKKIDEKRYMRRCTIRKHRSNWSVSNIKKAEKMIKNGKMTDFGMNFIKEAKTAGMWIKEEMDVPIHIPEILELLLTTDSTARNNFDNFADGYKRAYVRYILAAKREETTKKRAKKVFEWSKLNKKPMM